MCEDFCTGDTCDTEEIKTEICPEYCEEIKEEICTPDLCQEIIGKDPEVIDEICQPICTPICEDVCKEDPEIIEEICKPEVCQEICQDDDKIIENICKPEEICPEEINKNPELCTETCDKIKDCTQEDCQEVCEFGALFNTFVYSPTRIICAVHDSSFLSFCNKEWIITHIYHPRCRRNPSLFYFYHFVF